MGFLFSLCEVIRHAVVRLQPLGPRLVVFVVFVARIPAKVRWAHRATDGRAKKLAGATNAKYMITAAWVLHSGFVASETDGALDSVGHKDQRFSELHVTTWADSTLAIQINLWDVMESAH
jgi:hypothetical protein